jgi:hypothetical protein
MAAIHVTSSQVGDSRGRSLAGSWGTVGVSRSFKERNVILFRRLFLVISIVVTGSLGMAAAAIAAGGGGGLPPGNYTFNNTCAFAQFGTPIPPNFAPQLVINVQLDACANLQSF